MFGNMLEIMMVELPVDYCIKPREVDGPLVSGNTHEKIRLEPCRNHVEHGPKHNTILNDQ